MFLKKLFNFNRDYQYYQEKGEKSFADERYSDARDAFGEALEMVGDGGDQSLILSLRGKYEESGNRLGELNLAEAEHAVRGGDFAKAEEHLSMVMELANDTSLRERAQKILAETGSRKPVGNRVGEMGPCTRCEEKGVEELHVHQVLDDDMESEDRLTLYFHSLPGGLPERYAAMGEKFARGCLLNLDGDKEGALKLFEEISAEEDNDILDYEKAIIYYHKGETGRCEQLLIRAMESNALNPLCHIGLVHLYTDTGQAPKALPVLKGMIERDLVPEQALFMQGEIYAMLGDEINAIESYSRNLSSPRYAGEAAKRLIPLLEKHGRFEEASFLIKKFTKGCC